MEGMHGKERIRIVPEEERQHKDLPDHLHEVEYDIPARFRAVVLRSQIQEVTEETRKRIRQTIDNT